MKSLPAETSQIRAREGSVGHVEVFQMGSVRTPIFGGPRPPQPTATPQPRTTLPTPSIVKSLLSHPVYDAVRLEV